MKNKEKLSAEQRKELCKTLETRFGKNSGRHQGIDWSNIQLKLEANAQKLWSINEMERTGGEPDVVGYDVEAQESRKNFKPHSNAIDMAAAMGIELLTEQQYRELQKLGNFDTKTSSWIKTPSHIRKLGGALFCDRRYDIVFVYHNGAESYYAARAFRGSIRV